MDVGTSRCKEFCMLNIWEALTGKLRNLQIVNRYQTIPVLHKESVAAHITMTIWISYCLAREIEGRDVLVDTGKVLEKAFFHDIGECDIGDIVRVVKHSNKDLLALLDSAEEQSVKNLEREVGISGLVTIWKDAKDSSIEGQIVRLADFLSVVSYCQQELELGNHKIKEILREVAKYLKEIVVGKGKVKNEILKSIAFKVLQHLEIILSVGGDA